MEKTTLLYNTKYEHEICFQAKLSDSIIARSKKRRGNLYYPKRYHSRKRSTSAFLLKTKKYFGLAGMTVKKIAQVRVDMSLYTLDGTLQEYIKSNEREK